MEKGNIIFCGVGGQGILLASEITSFALMKAGFDIKKSEVHGMAQRGGSVVAHMRFGDKVYSPLIEPGTVDIALAFEMLESLRYLPYLNKNSRVIVNTQKILPSSVSTGIETYPENILEELNKKGLTVFPVDAFEIAESAGEIRAVNMALVGALSVFLPVEEKLFHDVISEHMPEKIRKVNTDAFIKGRSIIKKLQEVNNKS
ncbi:MAG: indolepyruvate oxidoreductase subunit beta [Nitrospiraceae bacterium]|nr:indolepyruvate oxidoreductase subunit beta [Nitrospiraceae bacterium]